MKRSTRKWLKQWYPEWDGLCSFTLDPKDQVICTQTPQAQHEGSLSFKLYGWEDLSVLQAFWTDNLRLFGP